jgi:hypothetical protein
MSKLRPIEWAIILAIFAIIWTLLPPTSSGSTHFFSPDTLQSKYRTESRFGPCVWQSSDKSKDSELVKFLVKNRALAATSN